MSGKDDLDVNLEEKANIFSKMFFWWVQGIIQKGFKAPLERSDVFACHTKLRSKTLNDKLRFQWDREKCGPSPSLTRAILRANSSIIAVIVTLSIGEAFFFIVPTVLVSKVSAFFDPASGVTFREALIYGIVLTISNLCYCFLRSSLFWFCHTLGPILRIQTSSLVYDKATKINSAALSKTSLGHVITLVTNDAERFNDGVIFFKNTVGIPLTFVASFILSYKTIGIYSTITAFTAILIVLPGQYFIGRGVAVCRRKAAPHTDKRIKLVGEMIASMKIIKVYKWESVFSNAILSIRKMESKYVGFFVLLKCTSMIIPFTTPLLGLLALLLTKFLIKEDVTSEMVFFFLLLGEILRKTVNMGIGAMFLNIPQFKHSLARIQCFLMLEERVVEELRKTSAIENGKVLGGEDNNVIESPILETNGVLGIKYIVKESITEINGDESDVITNPIAKENADESEVFTNSIVKENSDESDVFNNPIVKENAENVRSPTTENVEGGTDQPEDMLNIGSLSSTWGGENRFVLSNINMKLRRNTLTGIIGPVGSGKSSIIMTIIKEMEFISGTFSCPYAIGFYNQVPWIFNGSVEENILFNRPLDKARLQQTIESCYLLTDLEMLPHGLDTIVGERGVQLSGGQRARVCLARVAYGKEDIVLLDDPLSAVDTKCANHIFNRLIKEQLSDKTVVLVTHNTSCLSQLDHIYIMSSPEKEGEEIVGRVEEHGSYADLQARGLVNDQSTLDDTEKALTEEESEVVKVTKDVKNKAEVVKEDRNTGLIDKGVYQRFWSLGYGPFTLGSLLCGVIVVQSLKIAQERQALIWVEDGGNNNFILFAIMSVAAILLHFFSDLFIACMVVRCTRALHNMAFNGVMNSPMRYFDTTPAGIIINRFAKDTMQSDERIAMSFTFFSNVFINFLASMIILCVANYYMVLVLLPLMMLMCLVLLFYLRSSVEVRRLEAIERSPVMSHINNTLTGMSTIRASRQVDVFVSRYFSLRDRHTSTEMIFKAIERWLAIRLDLIVTLIGFLATITCIYLKDLVGPELAGLGMVYVQTKLGSFQYCIRMGAETENLMTAVERIFSLADLPSEKDPNKDMPVKRPSLTKPTGVVEFEKVSLRYSSDLPYVLREVTFKTNPREKIGVVGRTGAGKSSLIQALYRMCEVEGRICINAVDTSTQSLTDLRSSISVIPQESLLFSGSLRDNLDPYQTFNDEVLWDTLEKVQLKTYIASKGGLLLPVEEMGCNLSVGQRQLLCLARALLKETSVLVVDEATANVDQETDAAIQNTIRKCFEDRTVITIAHRLNTIIDSDRIMVMDGGRLVEFDTPASLLNQTSSYFYSLVHAKD